MVLVFDIGNSYIKIALFNKDKIINFKQFKHDEDINLTFLKGKKIKIAVISSVVKKANKSIINLLKKFNKNIKVINIDKLNVNLKMNIKESREDIGSDLIADLYATKKLYKGPAIIFDIGTVSKVLALDKNNVFIGANFFPGIEMMSKALYKGTEALPFVALKNHKNVIGKNTNECISSGIFNSIKYTINGFINDYKKEMKVKAKVIFTGGGSILIKDEFCKYIFNDKLTLLGIYYIYKESI